MSADPRLEEALCQVSTLEREAQRQALVLGECRAAETAAAAELAEAAEERHRRLAENAALETELQQRIDAIAVAELAGRSESPDPAEAEDLRQRLTVVRATADAKAAKLAAVRRAAAEDDRATVAAEGRFRKALESAAADRRMQQELRAVQHGAELSRLERAKRDAHHARLAEVQQVAAADAEEATALRERLASATDGEVRLRRAITEATGLLATTAGVERELQTGEAALRELDAALEETSAAEAAAAAAKEQANLRLAELRSRDADNHHELRERVVYRAAREAELGRLRVERDAQQTRRAAAMCKARGAYADSVGAAEVERAATEAAAVDRANIATATAAEVEALHQEAAALSEEVEDYADRNQRLDDLLDAMAKQRQAQAEESAARRTAARAAAASLLSSLQ